MNNFLIKCVDCGQVEKKSIERDFLVSIFNQLFNSIKLPIFDLIRRNITKITDKIPLL